MSSISLGGATVVKMDLTYSWGATPASAEIKCKGTTNLACGDAVILNIASFTFHGIIVSDPVETSDSTGVTLSMQVVDNREKLKEDIVLCRFNRMQVLEDNPTTPGIDRWRRYEHIFPGKDWQSQTKTITNLPLSAKQILDKVFDAATVNTTWQRSYHVAQDDPCHEIDASRGKKLVNVVSEVTEAQGLVFTLAGENQLIWARKGDDTAPAPDNLQCYNITDGHSLNSNDTALTIVGDPNRYQDMGIDLDADWAHGWESFWIESAWRDEVNTQFGPFDADDKGQALLTARSRTVTVREYCAKVPDATTFIDPGKLGEIARMDLPAWVYLQRVVYHAYRVPYGYTINGVPRNSLTLVEEMLIEVDGDIDSGVLNSTTPERLYPDGPGYVMAQGQQLGIIDPRTQRYITADQLAASRTKWAPVNKFKLDRKNYCVLFEEAVFLPGTDDAGLFVFPNQASELNGEISPAHPLYNICVPNQNVTATAAAVRASLTFDVEFYSKVFGTGRRMGAEYIQGLNYHSLLRDAANFRQIFYQDGKGADDKAQDYAKSKISNQEVYQRGGFNRKGAVGTALNGSIDRITVTLDDKGISERIEYTKERGPNYFIPENELERRQKERDRYPGERVLREEVRSLEFQAAIADDAGARPTANLYRHMAEVVQRPVGCEHAAPVFVNLVEEKAGGDPVFVEADGTADDGGPIFAGVVIAQHAQGNGVSLAAQGTVPVRVLGPFCIGDTCLTDSSGVASASGDKPIGRILGSYGGDKTVLVPVRMGEYDPPPFDFEVRKAAPPPGHETETGWVKINDASTLRNGLNPGNSTDVITIDDLGEDGKFQLDFSSTAEQYIWIAIDVSPLFAEKPGPATAKAGHKEDWNGETGKFFPYEVEWDTDDGTTGGSDGTAPANRNQKTCFFPIARTFDISDNPTDPVDPPGIMLTDTIKLVQVCRTPMEIYDNCAGGDGVILARPCSGMIPG